MAKKVALIAIILGLVGGTVYFLMTKQPGESTLSSLTQVIDGKSYPFSGLPHGDLNGDSLVKSLNDQTLMVAVLNPRNVDPLFTHLQKIRDRFSQTQLWKKLNLDQMIGMMIEQQFAQNAGMAPGLPTSPTELLDIVRREWTGIKELSIAVSRTTFAVHDAGDDKFDIPKILLRFSFSDQAGPNRLNDLISNQLLGGKTSMTADNVTIERAGDRNFYNITISPPSGEKVRGAVEFVGTEAIATFGTPQKTDFLAASAGGPAGTALLVQSDHWREAGASLLPNPAFFMFFDLAEIFNRARLLDAQTHSGGMGSQAFEEMLSNGWMSGFGGVAVSMNFTDGIGSRSCGRIVKDSKAAAMYKALFDQSQADKNSPNTSANLVNDKTVFAMELAGHTIQAYVDSLSSMAKVPSAEELQQHPEKYTPEIKRSMENYLALSKLLNRNPIKQVGFVLNAPKPEDMGMLMQAAQGEKPMPDFNVYLEFRKPISSADFSKLLNNLATLFLADSGMVQLPVATTSPAPAELGGDLVQINLGAENHVVGAAVSENAIVLGKDAAAITSAKNQMKQPASIVKEEALTARGLGGFLNWSDMYWYIGSSPVIEIGRSFAPMGMMMIPPQMQVTMNDVEEVLNLLNVRLLSIQNTAEAADGVYCSEARGVAL